jgi:hypothetical protein
MYSFENPFRIRNRLTKKKLKNKKSRNTYDGMELKLC